MFRTSSSSVAPDIVHHLWVVARIFLKLESKELKRDPFSVNYLLLLLF